MARDWAVGEECVHGHLGRKCDVCARDDEIADLLARLARYESDERPDGQWLEHVWGATPGLSRACLAIGASESGPIALLGNMDGSGDWELSQGDNSVHLPHTMLTTRADVSAFLRCFGLTPKVQTL